MRSIVRAIPTPTLKVACALLWVSRYSEARRAPAAEGRRGGIGLGLGGISFLKTVNTLQVALQKHKGGDGPSKHEVHLQRCQEWLGFGFGLGLGSFEKAHHGGRRSLGERQRRRHVQKFFSEGRAAMCSADGAFAANAQQWRVERASGWHHLPLQDRCPHIVVVVVVVVFKIGALI